MPLGTPKPTRWRSDLEAHLPSPTSGRVDSALVPRAGSLQSKLFGACEDAVGGRQNLLRRGLRQRLSSRMRKELTVSTLEPYTAEEEAALVEKLQALGVSALAAYVEAAENSLGNKALAVSWRPRIELGLKVARAALSRATGER